MCLTKICSYQVEIRISFGVNNILGLTKIFNCFLIYFKVISINFKLTPNLKQNIFNTKIFEATWLMVKKVAWDYHVHSFLSILIITLCLRIVFTE